MIANLMMYKRPQLVGAHERYWSLIRQNLSLEGMDSPSSLSQEAEEFFVWNHPDLVLSQTCGMPYRLWLHDKVALVGTPDYEIQGCPPGYYRSALVVRRNDPRETLSDYKNAIFAYNQTFSQSGYAAPYWHVLPNRFWFQNRLHTEQHLLSAWAVAGGHADIASLDAVSWRLVEQYEPFSDSLRVLDWTVPTPGLPLITAKTNDPEKIFNAVQRAITDLPDVDRLALGLKDILKIPGSAYLSVPNPPGIQPSNI
jgi:ABC-type phosphate/phosphonate transport system substrate-binding protein